jgi:hypothetical protein
LENTQDPGSASLDGISATAVIYLGIPTALFLAGWLRLPIALLMIVGLGYCVVAVRRLLRGGSVVSHFGRVHLVYLCVAMGWVSFGGAGHFFYANRFDWVLRDAVLRDLSVASWPLGYDIGGPVLWMLRCPVGYYLPAALCAKALGRGLADTLLWWWTVGGVWIFLCLLPIDFRRYRNIAIAILIVVAFSGMDILGWWTLHRTTPPLYKHMEWWARVFQYSSNTTLLFWVPNHAIPAWIVAGLFWRHWKTDEFLALSPLLLALAAIWSPFPVFGMAPFYGLLLVRVVGAKKWRVVNLPLLSMSFLILFFLGAYFSMDIGGIPGGSSLNSLDFVSFLVIYPIFVIVEFGVLWSLIWRFDRGSILVVSAAVLLLLPTIRFGPGNDLAMRSSIPSLTFLCLAAVAAFGQSANQRRSKHLALGIVLAVGAVTPLHEFYRAVTLPAWQPSQTLTVMNQHPVPIPHYVARTEKTWRTLVFRELSTVIKTSTASHPLLFSPQESP